MCRWLVWFSQGVYIEIQAGETNGHKRKTLHTNSIICLTLKGTGTISAWKAVTFVTFKEKQMVHIRKPIL